MLVEERAVTKAAERLGLSQPAMSHALARLRDIFGDPLLTRGSEGLVPTARAQELYEKSSVILQGLDGLMSPRGAFDPRTSEDTFVLTATEYTEHILLGRLMAVIAEETPQIRIEFWPAAPTRVMGLLERREVDFRLGWVYEPHPVLRSRPLFEEKLVVITRRAHPDIDGSISLEQYVSSRHVHSEVVGQRTTGRAIDDVLGPLARKLVRRVKVQSALTIPNAVANSDLIATVPFQLAAESPVRNDLQILAPPMRLPTFKCSAYWHETVHREPRHRWFRTVLERVAQALRSG